MASKKISLPWSSCEKMWTTDASVQCYYKWEREISSKSNKTGIIFHHFLLHLIFHPSIFCSFIHSSIDRLLLFSHSMDMSLGNLQELVMDRKAWHAVVHEVTKSQTRLSDWTELKLWPTLWDPMDCSPPGSSVHAISQPRTHNGAGCHFLLQGIFLSQESSPHLPHWQVDSLPLSYSGSLHFIVAIL